MKAVAVREAVVIVYTVAGLLMLDVLVRALVAGYDAAHLGGFDGVVAITLAIYLFNHTRLGQFAKG